MSGAESGGGGIRSRVADVAGPTRELRPGGPPLVLDVLDPARPAK